jgi:hypothetical protein
LSNVESGCNLHSRRVVRLKDLQEEKTKMLSAMMGDSSVDLDVAATVKKEESLAKAKKDHKDRIYAIERENEMQRKQD